MIDLDGGRTARKAPIGGYISDCKVCRFGVYGSQPYAWYGPPKAPLGISHVACVG